MNKFISSLREIIASPLYGLAIPMYQLGKFKITISLLIIAYRIYPYIPKPELYFSTLGRSYLATNKHIKALSSLERSYSIYQNSDTSKFATNFYRDEYIDMLHAYSTVLNCLGQNQKSKKILSVMHKAQGSGARS